VRGRDGVRDSYSHLVITQLQYAKGT
jgi:hypothetical protein